MPRSASIAGQAQDELVYGETEGQPAHCAATKDCSLTIDVEAYYRRYGPMVLRRCRLLLRDEEQAVDAMQDTFVQLLRYQHRLSAEAPSSLLYRMATNICLNRLRTQRRRPEDSDHELLQRIASLDDTESRLLARVGLDRLWSKERVSTRLIATLHLLDGMTLEEVAQVTGLSVSGVRKRLRQLRERLSPLDTDRVGEGSVS